MLTLITSLIDTLVNTRVFTVVMLMEEEMMVVVVVVKEKVLSIDEN
jgi:hypothetical protein